MLKILTPKEEKELNFSKRSSSYYNYKKIRKLREDILPGFNEMFDLIEDGKRTLKSFGVDCTCIPFSKTKCKHFYRLKRFPWRFRMAQHKTKFLAANKEIECEPNTRICYEYLNQFFMVWSSLEVYCSLFGFNLEKFFEQCSIESINYVTELTRKFDHPINDKYLLGDHLISFSEADNPNLIYSFLRGDNTYFMFYCRHIRNMYVHGELSARPNGVNAKKFSFFLQALANFFITEIKTNFSRKS